MMEATTQTEATAGAQVEDCQGAADRYQPVTLGEFVRQDVQRREWAIEGVWPEKRSGIIAGSPKGGKSTISLEMAVSLATGQPFLGEEEFKVRGTASVTYIQAENSPERLRRDLDEILVARNLGWMEPVIELYPNEQGEHEEIGQRFHPRWSAREAVREPDLQILSHPGMNLLRSEADREWLKAHADERDYIVLDPMWRLAAINTNDQEQTLLLLDYLDELRNDHDCGVILTHQMTDKHGDGDPAARMLGSTYYHGWYETAIFTRRSRDNTFSLSVDNLREMGEERTIVAQGLGVGEWYYCADAQDKTDSAGRAAPRTAAKATRIARLREMVEEHGEDWDDARYAEELNVETRTVRRYRAELNAAGAD